MCAAPIQLDYMDRDDRQSGMSNRAVGIYLIELNDEYNLFTANRSLRRKKWLYDGHGWLISLLTVSSAHSRYKQMYMKL